MKKKAAITINTVECDKEEKRAIENMLLVALARCGYSPYLNWDRTGVCYTETDTENIEEVGNG